jgi:hypothetical protein
MTIARSELKFVDFKVIEEPWNEYKLEDGSTLRVKIVLKQLIKEAEDSFTIGTSNVIAVIPNPDFVGLPSPPLKKDKSLESYIEADDLQINSQTELWNEYELASERMRLKIRGVVVSAARTKRHDEKGIPIYVANVQMLIKPKKRRK